MSGDSDSAHALLSNEFSTYKLYRRRFYIMSIFGFLAFNQTLFWLTFSPIARNVEVYYNITETTIDLFLNWGNIICIPTFPIAYLLLNKLHGVRLSMIIFSATCLVATLLRIIPSMISKASDPDFSSVALPFLHIGQILNAACSPLIQVSVSQISCAWFDPNERTRATTFGLTMNNLGSAIGFLVSPMVVSVPEHVPRLLYIHAGFAFVACVLTLVYFPSHPPTSPSPAAMRLITYSSRDDSIVLIRDFMKGLRQCFLSPSFMLLSIVGGLTTGTFNAWTGLYDVILAPEHYTEQQAGESMKVKTINILFGFFKGWFGFGSILAGIVGGLCFGALADTHGFRRSLKILTIISLIGCLLSIIWFELSIRTLFYNKPILSSTSVTIGLAICLAGFFQGASLPLIYEALAELMFPLPESISALAINQWNNVSSLVLLFLAPNRYQLMNLLVLIIIGVCIVMVSFSRVSYKRRNEDERNILEQQHRMLNNDSWNSSENEA